MAPWTPLIVAFLLWLLCELFYDNRGLTYFLYFALCMTFTASPAMHWFMAMSQPYQGSDASWWVLLGVGVVWLVHLARGESDFVNYVLFTLVCLAITLSPIGVSILGSFHH